MWTVGSMWTFNSWIVQSKKSKCFFCIVISQGMSLMGDLPVIYNSTVILDFITAEILLSTNYLKEEIISKFYYYPASLDKTGTHGVVLYTAT